MTNTIQGNDAVLSLYKNDWVVFLCATDIGLQIDIDVLQTRGPGDGHWGKNTYQKINYSISLSGALKMNNTSDTNFSGFDTLENIKGFVHLPFMISYIDDADNVKSVQGQAMITGLNFGATAGSVVKNDVNFLGDGDLMYFDGYFPCESTISTITIDGQTDEDGIVNVTFTYTGSPYQVKYQIDGAGMWFIALVGPTIAIPGLPLGDHSIEMIPICLNGYDGTGLTQAFEVTRAETCTITTTSITINDTSTTATVLFSSAPGTFKYRIDSGSWFTVPGTSVIIPISSLDAGDHTIEVVPICSNGISGTGTTLDFTISSRPSTTTVSYSMANDPYPDNYFQVFVNGILRLNVAATQSGSIVVNVGDNVKAAIHSGAPPASRALTLSVMNEGTDEIMYNHSAPSPATFSFFWVATADTFQITATISA